MKKLNEKHLQQILTEHAKNDIRENRLAGVRIIVSQQGKKLADLSLGYARFGSMQMYNNTFFRLASMTKPVTAAACAIAMQQGMFSLEDELSRYYPAFNDMYVGKIVNGKLVPDHKLRKPIKIWHLLSHCSGILSQDPVGVYQFDRIPKEIFRSSASVVEYCAQNTMLSFDPGSQSSYSATVAFDIVTKIIEMKSGMPYEEFLKKNVFAPLEITDITYHPSEAQWKRMCGLFDRLEGAEGFNFDIGRHTYEGFPLTYVCGGGGMTGSADDYWKFAEMMRQHGIYNGKIVIDRKYWEMIVHPYIKDIADSEDDSNSWGLGIRVVTGKNVLPKGSFGWSGAYGTHFFIDAENEITAIYLKNNRWYGSSGCGETGRQFEKDVMASLEDK